MYTNHHEIPSTIQRKTTRGLKDLQWFTFPTDYSNTLILAKDRDDAVRTFKEYYEIEMYDVGRPERRPIPWYDQHEIDQYTELADDCRPTSPELSLYLSLELITGSFYHLESDYRFFTPIAAGRLQHLINHIHTER